MRKSLLWMLLGGMVYFTIEGIWRIPTNGGWSNIVMLLVGGVCFVLVGAINQIPAFYSFSMRRQAFIGMLIVLAVEFVSGCIINICLHMGIWDYSHMPFNIAGQVCLLYGGLWFLLLPFAIWLEDFLNCLWQLKDGGTDAVYEYTLLQAYKELWTGKPDK